MAICKVIYTPPTRSQQHPQIPVRRVPPEWPFSGPAPLTYFVTVISRAESNKPRASASAILQSAPSSVVESQVPRPSSSSFARSTAKSQQSTHLSPSTPTQAPTQARPKEPLDLTSIGVYPFDAVNYPHLLTEGSIWYPRKLRQKIVDPAVQKIIDELTHHGPFAKKTSFPEAAPFRARYEIERVARHCGFNSQDLISKLDCSWDDYDELWKALRSNLSKPLERTRADVWNGAVGDFKDPNDDFVVTLSAELIPSKVKGRFSLTVNTMKYERGHRFGRRFGPDRFLELIIPQMKGKKKTEHEAITRWLATHQHYLFGRTWRAFYYENRKAVSQKLTAKVNLFAVDGDDFAHSYSQEGHLDVAPQWQLSSSHTPMTIEALINWLIPLNKNDNQKDLKLFQRIHLGLSRTTPTAVLQKNEVFFVPDMKSPTGETMNDGCSLMSRSLAQHISEMLDLSHIPAAFQARISGAKGMWIVDKNDARHPSARNFWVEINESQLKIFPPPSEDERELDDEQLTFGVVKYFESLSPAELNVQALRVLQHGGIEKTHVGEMIKHEIDLAYQEFKEVVKPKKAIQTRKWLQRWLRPSRTDQKVKRVDEIFPLNDAAKALALIDAGFLPLGLPYLRDIFTELLREYFKQLESLHPRVSRSTYAFCIADPYGVLEPGEVDMGFSRAWEHDFVGTELDDVDLLVARLPAHLPTDIQKRRAVYKRELSHLKDVMIFPTKGDIPLASELSGGDYDGDMVWVCWDSKIVDVFQNTPFSTKGPDRAPEVFKLVDHSKPFDGIVDEFLAKSFSFNAISPMLGICTNEHEKLCYQQDSIATEEAIVLADLLGHLVDSAKSGMELTSESWSAFTKSVLRKLGISKLPELAHKKQDDATINFDHIIDYLKFKVIEGEKQRVFKDFHSFCGDSYQKDEDLMKPWQDAMTKLEKDPHVHKEVTEQIVKVRNQWMTSRSKAKDAEAKSSGPKPSSSKSFESDVMAAVDAFNAIKPPRSANPMCIAWKHCPYEWKLALASCTYCILSPRFAFLVAGYELCAIKARSKGPGQSRLVVNDVHQALRVSRSSIKKIDIEETEELEETADAILNQPGESPPETGEIQDQSWSSYV
ncbi:hypothetical protein KEM56_002889 [Ascosphaera pollenicola]|nr:hypothetical protein KEM56_002889 [Ascosphaera pollenicola]